MGKKCSFLEYRIMCYIKDSKAKENISIYLKIMWNKNEILFFSYESILSLINRKYYSIRCYNCLLMNILHTLQKVIKDKK